MTVENVTRHEWISVAAYYKAEARNFAPGKELDDWLLAENVYVMMKIALYLAKSALHKFFKKNRWHQRSFPAGLAPTEKVFQLSFCPVT